MKFTVSIDENCEQALHETTCGDAFALDLKKKFALFGGQYYTTLVNLEDPTDIVKQIELKTPTKWFVTNYQWDPLCVNGSERFLQTRNKLIELVNCETSETCITLNGHGRSINDAKWSPFKKNLIASSSADGNITLWNTEQCKPAVIIPSVGEPDCLSWNKLKENVIAVSVNNDIRIYDIRKTNSAFRYISNAHTKKIYSLDWCANEEILLSSSRDRNIKLWNFNMLNQKFMEKILEDFPCWKAKFTPFGLCFAVIPTCLSPPKASQYINQNLSPVINTPGGFETKYPFTDINNTINNNRNNNKTSLSNLNSPDNLNRSLVKNDNGVDFSLNNSENIHPDTTNDNSTNSQKTTNMVNSKNDPVTSLLICQIMSFDEAKIYKFTTKSPNMILNYDFYQQNDKFKIVSWTQNQSLCNQSIDLVQLVPKDNLDKNTSLILNNTNKFEEGEIGALKSSINTTLNNNNNQTSTTALHIQPNTTQNSSRKSSISEYGYGTPPSNLTSILSNRMMNERESINLNDIVGHDFLKRNPKCFGAKFSGLPEQFIIFPNEGITQNSTKMNQREHENNMQFTKRRTHTKSKVGSKFMYGKHLSKRSQSRVYIYDISFLLHMGRDFAELYNISESSLQSICEQNITTAINFKRYDIVRIWQLIKFVTFNKIEKFSLNPDHGRPWSCSTFGRPLITNIIDNCINSNDIQTAAMIISKLKQHDMNMIPLASTVNRQTNKFNDNHMNSCDKLEGENFLPPSKSIEYSGDSDFTKHHRNLGLLDPGRMNEFDVVIKFYCEILYQWGLFNKRIEMLEFIYEKPSDYDKKFECSKKSTKSILNCSICFTPVNGLSTYCVICGHGGHYDHLIEWFKRHDDCPSACGCRCVDYL